MIEHLGIYIHTPFCSSKCAYCDFFSLAQKKQDTSFWQNYLQKIKADFLWQKKMLKPSYRLGSVFFGGGTPSVAPDFFLQETLEFLLSQFAGQSLKRIEITAEANPDSLTKQKLHNWQQAGFNRVHAGVQSSDPAVLAYLGRQTGAEQARNVFSLLARGPIENYGFDFIFGVPGQSWQQLKSDLDLAIEAGARHISAYSLTIEEGTLLARQIARGEKKNLSLRRQVFQQKMLADYLQTHGFRQYEISNFARPGFASRHNLGYWRYRPYLGLGAGAHAFIDQRRFYHPDDLEKYLHSDRPEETDSEAASEIFIGLFRLKNYSSFSQLKRSLKPTEQKRALQKLAEFEKQKLLRLFAHGLQMTDEGLLFSDSLLAEMNGIFSGS